LEHNQTNSNPLLNHPVFANLSLGTLTGSSASGNHQRKTLTKKGGDNEKTGA
jgi:hypothetical protein